jgi:predicted RNA binding protein YcfA (HicA-like mRNA interferase family)
MPKPIKWRELVRRLEMLGWEPPKAGGKHLYMRNRGRRLIIPNPHGGDVDWSLTKRLLAQAGIDPEVWEKLGSR